MAVPVSEEEEVEPIANAEEGAVEAPSEVVEAAAAETDVNVAESAEE
jgi:hypothetical protein